MAMPSQAASLNGLTGRLNTVTSKSFRWRGTHWRRHCWWQYGHWHCRRYWVGYAPHYRYGGYNGYYLRKHGFKKPIVMLTGNSLDADQILGFESGANDYITKPFKFGVLLARIRVHLRQHEQSEDAVFAIGPYSFKPATKILLNQKGAKEGGVDVEAPLSRGREGGDARGVAAGGVGL
jgi:hypothetical protein